MLELLKELTSIPGGAGFEDEVALMVGQEMGHCLDSVMDPLADMENASRLLVSFFSEMRPSRL